MKFTNLIITLFILIIITIMPGLALAHAHLISSKPAANSKISLPLSRISLNFSEGIIPGLSKIQVVGLHKQRLLAKQITLEPGNAKVATVYLNHDLIPGTYQVYWKVLSVDGHKTHGVYKFYIIK